ncbi:MAG: hypothetical protein HQ546_07550 [Planctomycetes bacterium]|nr:hypothetical protein [Planctomycetota bacterium]
MQITRHTDDAPGLAYAATRLTAALAVLLCLFAGMPLGCSDDGGGDSERGQSKTASDPAWAIAQDKGTLEAYCDYRKANPAGPHADVALNRIREMSIDRVVQQVIAATPKAEPSDSEEQPNVLGTGYMSSGKGTDGATHVSIGGLVTDNPTSAPPFEANSAEHLGGIALKVANGASLASHEAEEQQSVLWLLAQAAILTNGQATFIAPGFECLDPKPTSGPRLLSKSHMAGTGNHMTRTVPKKRALLGALTISERPDGGFLLQTVLPNEKLYMGWGEEGLMGAMLSVLPAAPGSIYRFTGRVSGFVPGYTVKADEGEALAFVVTKAGLCHIAGRGQAVAEDGTEIRLPIE